MSEIWSLVDCQGREVGISWLRSERESIPDGLYHPCVEVWIRIGDRLLLTRRHPNKSHGLMLDCPGGAVVLGEGMLRGACRELFEEVGIDAEVDSLLFLGSSQAGKVFAASYLLTLDTMPKIELQPSEVVGYELMSEDEIFSRSAELTPGTYRRFLMYKEIILGK